MSSLKEIKERISSVRSTLKITSAMKLVSSAKLRKAQSQIESMRPYERALQTVLSELSDSPARYEDAGPADSRAESGSNRVAIVAISSNSSLCGAFNANVIRELDAHVTALRSEGLDVVVIPIGKKVADYCRKNGFTPEADYSMLVGRSNYTETAALAQSLVDRFLSGEFSAVRLVYNHFVSTSCQKVVVEDYLKAGDLDVKVSESADFGGVIVEPGKQELLEMLLPKVIKLKLYTAVLDSVAAEHSARVVAMQTASDNAEDLLQELSIEFNKGRQQKITAELLDIVGGTMS